MTRAEETLREIDALLSNIRRYGYDPDAHPSDISPRSTPSKVRRNRAVATRIDEARAAIAAQLGAQR